MPNVRQLSAACFALCFASGNAAVSEPRTAVDAVTDANASLETRVELIPAMPVVEDGGPVGAGRAEMLRGFSKAELCDAAVAVAVANGLPIPFFTKLIRQESGFRPHVVSRVGAQGIAQFMPKTAASRGLPNPFEPIRALNASAKLLTELVHQFGNLGLAAAAYNAGPRRVREWMAKRGTLPTETKRYVHSITGRAAEAWAAAKLDQEVSFQSDWSCWAPAKLGDRVRIDDTKELHRSTADALDRTNLRPVAMRFTRSGAQGLTKLVKRSVGTAPNGRPIGSRGSGKGSPEDPW